MSTTQTCPAAPADYDPRTDYAVVYEGEHVAWVRCRVGEPSSPVLLAMADDEGEPATWSHTGRTVGSIGHDPSLLISDLLAADYPGAELE